MLRKKALWGSLLGTGICLITASPVAAEAMHQQESSFRRIEQPMAVKVGVVAGGLALIALELWWFLGEPRQKKPTDT